uniref:Uncharacterized protein n=1 Tax=Timema bartmani TaxID=61472 RepID=A0A7R9EWH2_9NEOP|nr:unnamed protein product [Timema bartmani]
MPTELKFFISWLVYMVGAGLRVDKSQWLRVDLCLCIDMLAELLTVRTNPSYSRVLSWNIVTASCGSTHSGSSEIAWSSMLRVPSSSATNNILAIRVGLTGSMLCDVYLKMTSLKGLLGDAKGVEACDSHGQRMNTAAILTPFLTSFKLLLLSKIGQTQTCLKERRQLDPQGCALTSEK